MPTLRIPGLPRDEATLFKVNDRDRQGPTTVIYTQRGLRDRQSMNLVSPNEAEGAERIEVSVAALAKGLFKCGYFHSMSQQELEGRVLQASGPNGFDFSQVEPGRVHRRADFEQRLEGWAHQAQDLGNRTSRVQAIAKMMDIFDGKGWELDIDHMQLGELPEEIGELRTLIQIKAAGNNLQVLPSSMRDLRNLQVLQLGGNQFEGVPRPVWSLIDKLKVLILEVGADKVGSPQELRDRFDGPSSGSSIKPYKRKG